MISDGDYIDGYKVVHANFAHGGVGVIHKVITQDNKLAALKILDKDAVVSKILDRLDEKNIPEKEKSDQAEEKYKKIVGHFKEEYQILISLRNPYIASAIGFGFWNGQFYSVSEFVDGRPMVDFVRGMKPARMIPIFIQILEGLDFIHRNGFIHLDIKSDNVLVYEEDGEARVKIIDFGLASKLDKYTGLLCGSIHYMAPEVVFGKRDSVDARADLFSLAVLMYYCVTWGVYPFPRTSKKDVKVLRDIVSRERPPKSVVQLNKKRPDSVPSFLDVVIMRLLSHDPGERFYSNARAVINALSTGLADSFVKTPAKLSYLRPPSNIHIGQTKFQKEVLSAIDDVAGIGNKSCMFGVFGDFGLGKTHLLTILESYAQRYADTLDVKYISLPTDRFEIDEWLEKLIETVSENNRGHAIFIDNIDCISRDSETAVFGLAKLMSEMNLKPKLHLSRRPILFIYTAREKHLPVVANLIKQSRFVELSPFAPGDIVNFLKESAAFKDKAVPTSLARDFCRITQGVPAELVEYLDAINDSGKLFTVEGVISEEALDKELDEISVKPSRTTELRLLEKIEKLPAEEQRVVNFISVWFAKDFLGQLDFATLEKFFPDYSLALRISRLVESEILKNDHTFKFEHKHLGEIVYNRINLIERMLLHDKIACHLELSGGYLIPPLPYLFHTGFGSNYKYSIKCLNLLVKELIYKRGRTELAAEILEYALSITPPSKQKVQQYLSGLLVDAYIFASRYADADDVLNNFSTGTPSIYLAIKKIHLLISKKKFDEAFDLAQKCLSFARDGSFHYLVLLNFKASILYQKYFITPDAGRTLLNEALKLSIESRRLERRLPEKCRQRIINNQLGFILNAKNNFRAAISEITNSLKKKEHTVFSKTALIIALADALRLSKKYRKAATCASEAISLAKNTGQGQWLMHAHGVMASIYHDMDKFDLAIEENNKYFAASNCLEGPDKQRHTAVRLWVQMGHCFKEKKDFDSAIAHFEAAAAAGRSDFYQMSAYEGLGEVYFFMRNKENANRNMASAQALLERLPRNVATDSHRFRILEIKSKIAIDSGDFDGAKKLLPQLHELAGSDKSRHGEYRRLKARIALHKFIRI